MRVLDGDRRGSGFIIKNLGNDYIILTNEHVLSDSKNTYEIQTPDGIIYKAKKLETKKLKNYDLALLQFTSNSRKYKVAVVGKSSELKIEEQVTAAGFPYDDSEVNKYLKITEGKICLILEKSFKQGYKIGYTNDIEQGMSGGPVINNRGEVVGVNGKHAYPLWGDSYVYENGEKPSVELQKVLNHYSWAIPMETFTKLVSDEHVLQ